jgi:catechol-2,3-dioxygenase
MNAPPPNIAFSHVGIFVNNLAKMADFYARFLGFTITDRGKLGNTELVFLSRDPREHHQVVLVAGRPSDTPFNVVNQISFRADSLKTLRDLYTRLQSEPVSEIAPVTHGNALSVYFRDPEGNRLEIFIDTPWYVTQPLRIPIDLSLSDDALWHSIEALVRDLPGFKSVHAWQQEMAERIARTDSSSAS